MLDRSSKEKIVQDLQTDFKNAQGVFLTNLIGVKSNDAVAIRKAVRDAGGKIKITRNTLIHKAAQGFAWESIFSNLKGPQAVAFAFKDAAAVAKKLTEVNKDFEPVSIKAGALPDKVLTPAEIKQLASLPSREQMLATVLATFNAPVSAFVRVLNAIKEKQEQGAGAAAAAPAAEPAPQA